MSAFQGITVAEIAAGRDDKRKAAVESIVMPEVRSWRQMDPRINPLGQVLWTGRPEGVWVAIMRYENELITTSADVPLDLEWARVYQMLAHHGATLFAVNGEQGLVAVGVSEKDNGIVPLMPGFFVKTTIDPRTLDARGMERLSEEGHLWPEGLVKPWILGMDKPSSLVNPEYRTHWLEQAPSGLWILAILDGTMQVYEVLS